MQCSLPPPLTDEQLNAALDNQAEPAVHDHLSRCSWCAARLAQAQQFDRTLHNALYRIDCPSPQQLGDYHLGLVDHTLERSIIRHVEHCQLCTQELEELRVFLTAGAAPAPTQPAPRVKQTPLGARLGELVAQLLPATHPQPGFALRGNSTGPIMAEADGTTIVLDVQSSANDQVMLMGQIVAEDQERWNGAIVELRQDSTIKAALTVDDLGSFNCTLPAGPTDVRITPERGDAIVLNSVELQA